MSDPGEGRVFVREMISQTYGLDEFRRRQLAAPRVRSPKDDVSIKGKKGYTEGQDAWWRVGPADDPFWTQTLQVHLVELPARGAAKGHGHQNEAPFYILEGAGYEIHDDVRYDWEQGDLVVAHVDSVHRHFNASDRERAVMIIMKAKSLWMYMGLLQQGRSGPVEDGARYGPREDWSQLWTPGFADRVKVVKRGDTEWQDTPDGRIRVLTSKDRTDQRIVSVDVYEQEIPPGGRSGKHWHMSDEVAYVIAGRGRSLHWAVEAEIAERYYARVAKQPTEHPFAGGDTIYAPPNTVHQHVNDGDEPLILLVGQNRIFKHIGYDNVVVLEPSKSGAVASTSTG
jgi:quercetin dioxygenase-like cupin family protein